MIELNNKRLQFAFPEVHKDARFSIEFERTLRIPDDNREYPLPPGLGAFPLFHVDDFSTKVPETWNKHGGVFMPMYQSEALWINFNSHNYPFALKIATGKINAVTGEDWSNTLHNDDENEQDYIVLPDQPWLDGYAISKGKVRQFVAMPLGKGYTAEEQIKGVSEHGGIQVIAYPMKKEIYEEIQKESENRVHKDLCMCVSDSMDFEMGLAPGGVMRQSIYDDEYGLEVWDVDHTSRCFIHIVNSNQFQLITDHNPPTKPITAKQYTEMGLPWFDYYDADKKVLEGASALAALDSVAAKEIKLGETILSDNDPVEPKFIKEIKPTDHVREGDF